MLRRTSLAALGLFLALAVVGCSDENIVRFPDNGPQTEPEPTQLTDYLSDGQISGTSTAYVAAAMPTGTSAAPVVDGASVILRGGSLVLEVEVADTDTDLYLSMTAADEGYYHFDLTQARVFAAADVYDGGSPRARKLEASGVAMRAVSAAAAQIVTVTLTARQDLALAGFTLTLASSDGQSTSATAQHVVSVNRVASTSGALQASLNWTHPVDLDLHVETPSGQDIYWANRNGSEGGLLDLDSNAGCGIDNVNNENIVWVNTDPVPGQYVVRVDLWSACGEPGPFPFVVTLVIDGEFQTHEGTFLASEEDGGGEGAGREIFRFTLE